MRSARLLGLAFSLLSLVALSACDVFISADGRIERARAEIAKGDYQAAVIDLKNALESEPNRPQARLLLAQASLQLGDVRDAEKELRRAREAGAKPEEVAELTAETQLALGQGGELLAQIDSKQIVLGEPLLSIYRGEALLAMGKPEDAAVAFEAALRVDPKRVRALIGLARARAGQRQADEALKLLDGVPQNSPEHAAALLCRGEILAAQGRFADAQNTLHAALALQGRLTIYQKATLFAILTESQLAAGDINGARASLQSLAQIAPTAPLTLMLGARIAMATQDYPSASAALQRVVVGMPDFVPARFLLGASLVAQGNLNQAESHLTRVVQLAPDNLEARKLLARVRLGIGRPDAALELLSPLQGDADSDVNSLIGICSSAMRTKPSRSSSVRRAKARAAKSNSSSRLPTCGLSRIARPWSCCVECRTSLAMRSGSPC
jgi:putative PEP-CTERM system TPR-repeat lipoprotein